MKLTITLTAAALLAGTAALAQSTAPSSSGSGMTPPASSTTDTGMSAPGSDMASADMMVMKDGKWMMGDRAATKDEIKAHKEMMKKDKMSKPM